MRFLILDSPQHFKSIIESLAEAGHSCTIQTVADLYILKNDTQYGNYRLFTTQISTDRSRTVLSSFDYVATIGENEELEICNFKVFKHIIHRGFGVVSCEKKLALISQLIKNYNDEREFSFEVYKSQMNPKIKLQMDYI